MQVFLGLLLIFSFILIAIGIIWFIVIMIKKGRFRYPIVVFVVGILLLISSSFGAYLVVPDYNAINEQEGKNFYQVLASGKDVQGESLTFTVSEIGSNEQQGLVGLGVVSTEEKPITVLLNVSGESQAIQSGDTVTVQINSISNFASLFILKATLE
ncbi:hypothetical protein [Virgibacillus sp. DJP39]|uniref:hypothetical protein n=1 Tax=Virgibacillus sp. DJP39 TaxID=3409790 RepID=UPI003BB8137B